MPKPQGRKPPRRKPPRTIELDDELALLAQVLDEQRLERNFEGWFSVPWRSGTNAFGLACAVAFQHESSNCVDAILRDLDATHFSTSELYENAESITNTVAYWPVTLDKAARAIRAACRCLQLKIAHSDGGGHGYNAILQRYIPFVSEELVLEWRGRDALGIEFAFDGNAQHNRVRQAFKIAWQRGMFNAAYALVPG